MKLEYNNIYNLDNIIGMNLMDDESIDLTITSPPYDNLRTYNGYSFDFENIVKELYRITKNGGVVVWIVSDATIKGSETGTSFEQALFFKKIGFNIHDTMIWSKPGFTDIGSLNVRYAQTFEYMFIFSKGRPKTFNPIKDRENKWAGKKQHGTKRNKDGTMKPSHNIGKIHQKYSIRYNVWNMNPQKNWHPAPFPEWIVKDHIISWSNEKDIVFDPFIGSGTTAKMAKKLNRNYIGFEISTEYFIKAKDRINDAKII